MADLVVRVVRDVLRHVPIEDLKGSNVAWSEPRFDFLAVLDEVNCRKTLIRGSAQFRILDPKVGFDLLKAAEEPEDSDIAAGDWQSLVVLRER